MSDLSRFINHFSVYIKIKKQNCFSCESSNKCYTNLMNNFLYEKFSSSQNYHYTKNINSILAGNWDKAVFLYNDMITDQDGDYLKRFYRKKDYQKKIDQLTEYYKFHEDVPRLFMKPLSEIAHNYYDKMRRINYIKITKMLNGEIDHEDIKIHDSDTSLSNKGTIRKSMLSILPNDLKISLYKKKVYLAESKRKISSFQSSFTVCELNEVLKSIFDKSQLDQNLVNESLMLNLTSKRIKTQFDKNEFEEQIKKRLFKKKWNNSKKIQVQTKLKNTKIKKILKKFDKNLFLKKIGKQKFKIKDFLKKKQSSKTIKQNLNVFDKNKKNKKILQKKFHNLNINNLNININFNQNKSLKSLSKLKKQQQHSPLYIKKQKQIQVMTPLSKVIQNNQSQKFIQKKFDDIWKDYESIPYSKTLDRINYNKRRFSDAKFVTIDNKDLKKSSFQKKRKKQLWIKRQKEQIFQSMTNQRKKSRKQILSNRKKKFSKEIKIINKNISKKINKKIKLKKNLNQSSWVTVLKQNGLNLFLSQEINNLKRGSSKNCKNLKISKSKKRPTTYNKNHKKSKMNSKNPNKNQHSTKHHKKYLTFANPFYSNQESIKFKHSQFNTINYLNLFNKKKRNSENINPKNYQQKLKSKLIRKIVKKIILNQF